MAGEQTTQPIPFVMKRPRRARARHGSAKKTGRGKKKKLANYPGRLPEDLRRQIATVAKREGVSFAQMCAKLATAGVKSLASLSEQAAAEVIRSRIRGRARPILSFPVGQIAQVDIEELNLLATERERACALYEEKKLELFGKLRAGAEIEEGCHRLELGQHVLLDGREIP